jgi:hypothetical protein
MKTYLFSTLIFCGLCVMSCKSDTDKEALVKSETEVALPMEVAYKGAPAIGSSVNTVTVMNWNKWLSNGNLDSAFTLLADSVTVRLASGAVFNTTADSIKTIIRGYFGEMSATNIQYVAVVPIDVKLENGISDQWVLSWTDEDYTMKDGKKEHNIIHEDYRLVNGKIREVNQYARKLAPPVSDVQKK